MCFSADKAPLVGCLSEEEDQKHNSAGLSRWSGQYISAGYGSYGREGTCPSGVTRQHCVGASSAIPFDPPKTHTTGRDSRAAA